MPKITRGPFAGMKGDLDGYIYYEYKGTTYVRKKVKSQYENSMTQLKKQHTKIKSMSALYRSVKKTLLYNSFVIQANALKMQSGYNLFTKENINCFEDFEIGDYSFLKLSVGCMMFPFKFRRTDGTLDILSLEWDLPKNGNAKDLKDILKVAVIYDDDPFNVFVPDIPTFKREDCMATVDVRRDGSKEAHVYCFFMNDDASAFTNSIYFNLNF